MFCFDLILVIVTSLRSAVTAARKGWSGLLFGILHGLIAIASECAGIMTGLLIGLKNDPFLDKQSAMKPILFGAGGGLAFGILLMMFVMALLPAEPDKQGRNRTFRPIERIEDTD